MKPDIQAMILAATVQSVAQRLADQAAQMRKDAAALEAEAQRLLDALREAAASA